MALSFVLKTGAIVALAVGCALPAFAQENAAPNYGRQGRAPDDFGRGQFVFLPPLLSVYERPREEYAARGFRSNGFIFLPQLRTSLGYNNNVFAENNNTNDDVILTLNPSWRLQSEWSEHLIGLESNAVLEYYDEQDGEDTVQGGWGAYGRYDLSQADSLFANANYQRTAQGRGDPEDTVVGDRVESDNYAALVGYNREGPLLSLRAQGQFRRIDFRNAADQDRDRNELNVSARLRYGLSARINPFVEVTYGQRDYDRLEDVTNINRNADTYAVLAGARFDLTGLIQGEAAIGVQRTDYDTNALRDFTAFVASGDIVWNITPLTSIIGGVSRTEEPTGVTGASSRVLSTIDLRVEHEVYNNILVFGQGRYTSDEFEGTNRSDDIYSLAAGGEYMINEYVSAFGEVRYTERESSAAGQDYDQTGVFFGARLQY